MTLGNSRCRPPFWTNDPGTQKSYKHQLGTLRTMLEAIFPGNDQKVQEPYLIKPYHGRLRDGGTMIGRVR